MVEQVRVNVYDLSRGMAKAMSGALLGKQLDWVPHTGVVVFGMEYFYGGGVQMLPPSDVVARFGITPVQTLELGPTELTREVFHDYLAEVSPRYTHETYDLLSHNCNNFSDEICKFLTGGKGLPPSIMDLPNEFLSTPMGQALQPVITGLQNQMHQQFVPLSGPSNLGQSVKPAEVQAAEKTTITVHLRMSSEAAQSTAAHAVQVAANATVAGLCDAAALATGFRAADLRVVYKGQILKMATVKTLDAIGICDGTTVHVVPKPGAQKEAPPAEATPNDAPEPKTQSTESSESADDSQMTVHLKIAEKKLSVAVSASGATVGDLCRKIAEVTGYRRGDVRVIYQGQILRQYEKTLDACRLRDGQTVHVVPKPGASPLYEKAHQRQRRDVPHPQAPRQPHLPPSRQPEPWKRPSSD